MSKRIFVILGVIIFCIAVFLLIRHLNVPDGKIDIEKISEKDFTTTVSDNFTAGSSDKGGSKRIDLPIRLKISDINNIIGIVTVSDILFKFAVAVIAMLVISLAVYFIKMSMKKPIVLSPYERAIKGLAGADPEKVRPGTALKELYFLLSRVIREYLKDSLGFGPEELTVGEFLKRLDEVTTVPDNARGGIKALILRYDFVKFSGDTVNIDAFKKDFAAAKELVDAINTALTPKDDAK